MNGIDNLINGAIKSGENKTLLRQHFESRLEFLGITLNQFCEGYEMAFRTINAILDGNFKYLDPISLMKIANFLNVSSDEILKECLSYMSANTQIQLEDSKKRTYILDNFNLHALKKDGVISSIKDFGHIEKCLLRAYGLKDIYEYSELDKLHGLFSSIKATLKDARPKKNFKNKAIKICNSIVNSNSYNQDDLKAFFPRIRAYSLDVETGLLRLIRELYKLGITVVIHPSLSLSGARGLTIESNGKPSIILTDIGKKYSTLWFTLIHELYHVVFDWEDILAGRLHVTDDDEFVNDKELKANEFAREYMFPRKRLEEISTKISDPVIVKDFAIESNVHYSIIYDNFCYDNPDQYPLYSRFIRVQWSRLQTALLGSLSHSNSPEEFAKYYQSKIFSN
jgi:HTH-type transcriptional regulator / antitoxin HigA